MKHTNASQLPKVYYGLHMVPGVAEYREPGVDPYRILVNSEAIRQMDPTFQGRPVYVFHTDEVDLANIQEDADGYVMESFYNAPDGNHWTKFIVVSDKGHEAVSKGWKLSNAYHVKSSKGAGVWHGVQYTKEVTAGEYDHLAIVPNPRYAESKILTPEQFKAYNSEKELELERLTNSADEEGVPMFFKKSKVENSKELEGMCVTLPKSKKEISLADLVKNADEQEMDEKKDYANGEHKVKVGDEEMTVNDLIEKHLEMKKNLDEASEDASEDKDAEHPAEENDEDEEAKKKALELAKHEEKEIAEKKQNDLAEKKKNFEKLKNAEREAREEIHIVDTSMDRVARGKSRYGSN